MAINWKFNKCKLTNIFYRSRWRLALAYSALMFCMFLVIIFLSYRGLIWAVSSEQARELSGVVRDIAEAEAILMQRNTYPDDLGYRERMFFYAYNNAGELQHFSKAPPRLEDDVLQIIHEGRVPLAEEAVFERQMDSDRVIMMTASYVRIDGEIVGIVYLGKDVTALYKGLTKFYYFWGLVSLLALIVAMVTGYYIAGCVMAPMQAAYERQKQFTADASHELRTPLSVVMASADLLSHDASIQSPFLQQVVADIKDEVKKMSKLVGDLMVIARNDNHAERLNVQEFDLSNSLEQVIRNMQPLAEKKHIALLGNIAEGIVYTGDEHKIKQLILILVDNAIKYTQEYGSVTVAAKYGKGRKISFSVADNGMGISSEDCKRIFGRFYRVDKARSREMGGNGLGLAIAKDIVDAHHGYIYLESKLGEGTTFSVELPQLKR